MAKEVSYEELVAHLMAAYQDKKDDDGKRNLDSFIDIVNRSSEKLAEESANQKVIFSLKRLCAYALELRSKAQQATKAYAMGDFTTARKLMRQARRAATDLKVQCSIFSLDKTWPPDVRSQCRSMVYFIETFEFSKGQKYLELQLDDKAKWRRYIKDSLNEWEEEKKKKGPGVRKMTDQQFFALMIAATMHEYAGASFDPSVLAKNLASIQRDPVFRFMASDPKVMMDYLRSPATVVRAWQNMSNLFVEAEDDALSSTVGTLKKLGKAVSDQMIETEEDGWVVFEHAMDEVNDRGNKAEKLEQIKNVTNSAAAYVKGIKEYPETPVGRYRMDLVIDALAIIARTSDEAQVRVDAVISKLNRTFEKNGGDMNLTVDLENRGIKHAHKSRRAFLESLSLISVNEMVDEMEEFLTDKESVYDSDSTVSAGHELAVTIALAKATVEKTVIGGVQTEAVSPAAIKKMAEELEQDEAVAAMAAVFAQPGAYRKTLLGNSEADAILNIEREYERIKNQLKAEAQQDQRSLSMGALVAKKDN